MNCKIAMYIIKKTHVILTIMFIIILCGCGYNANESKNDKKSPINLENLPEYDLAVEYYNAQNYDRAIVQYKYVLDNLDMETRGDTNYWIKGIIGACHTLMGEYEEAEPYILEAMAGLEKVGDRYYLFRIYEIAADYYLDVSDYNRALDFYDKCLIYAQEEEIIRANLGKARTYRALGEKQESLKYYDFAIIEGKKQQANGSLANAYFSLGIYWMKEEDLKEAKTCFVQGTEYAKKCWGDNDIKVAEGYRYLARVHSSEEDYQSAYSYCRMAMDIFNMQDDKYSYDRDIASLYNNMGSYNIDLGDYAASLEMFKKSYDIVREKKEQNEELLKFYENILSVNIKVLYKKSVSDDVEFEDWFKENFEE